jgi:hypothetical protein
MLREPLTLVSVDPLYAALLLSYAPRNNKVLLRVLCLVFPLCL